MNNELLKQQVATRIRENYESYLKDWLSQEPTELVALAEEIAATKLLYKSIPQAASPEDMTFLLQFENPLEVVRDGWMNYEQADISHELQYALSYARNNPSMWEDYGKSKNPFTPTSPSEPLTVGEFLEQHPSEAFDMMTPGGYVFLTSEKAQRLLSGASVMGNPGCADFDMEITADELLGQTVASANFHDGVWHMLSVNTPEQTQSGMEVTMC